MRRGPDPPRLKPCSLFAAAQARSCCSASRLAGRRSRLTAAPTTAAAAVLSATRRTAQAAQRQQRKGMRQRRTKGMLSMRPARCPCSRPAALPGSTWWKRWALSMYAAVQWLPPLSCVCCPVWIHLTDNAGRRCLDVCPAVACAMGQLACLLLACRPHATCSAIVQSAAPATRPLLQSYPELIPHLSSCKSPQMMMGAVVKVSAPASPCLQCAAAAFGSGGCGQECAFRPGCGRRLQQLCCGLMPAYPL